VKLVLEEYEKPVNAMTLALRQAERSGFITPSIRAAG
jgi:hypothetical protein